MSYEQRLYTYFDTKITCDSCEQLKLCAPFDNKEDINDTIHLCEGCLFGMSIMGFEKV